MLDPQVGDVGLVGIAFLQGRDVAPAVVAQRAQLVQFGGVPGGDKTAVAGAGRKVRRQGAAEPFDQLREIAERAAGVGDQARLGLA